jgi:acyl transferase domain-containing protein
VRPQPRRRRPWIAYVDVMSTDLPGIAIIGMAARFPGAATIDAFWENLRGGVESIQRSDDGAAADEGREHAVRVSAMLDGYETFDAAFFGYPAAEAEVMDPQHRVFLECAWEALEDAGYDAGSRGLAAGVFGGCTINTYLLANLSARPDILAAIDPTQLNVANGGDFFTTRVSYKLGLRGPSHAVQSACSTSLVAVHAACQSLINGECDLALAGGASVNVTLRSGYVFRPGGILSPDGFCRPFDARARGTIFGSGVGVVVLKRLGDALDDGDAIDAVILGTAVNNDGALKVGYTAPSVEGQAEVIAEALANAGVAPDTIGYIEAHGTGTAIGDPIEVRALAKAFGAQTERRDFCALGSVKGNVGHLDAAAGVAGLIKTVLALKHRTLPPSLHYERPNPEIAFETTPFYVSAHPREWPADETPRRAGVSAFGVGGTNAHVVLEEAPTRARTDAPLIASEPVPVWHLLPLSARTESALETMTDRLAAYLRTHPEQLLADVAYTLQVGRREFEYRRFVVGRDASEVAAWLVSRDADHVISGRALENAPAGTRIGESENVHAAAAAFLRVVGNAWSTGSSVDWMALHPAGSRRRVHLPAYPFERRRYWIEPRVSLDTHAAEAAITSGQTPVAARSLAPRPPLSVPYVEPSGEIERTIAEIWRRAIGLEAVGALDNFFDLGADSLAAVQVMSQVREMLDVELPAAAVYEHLTIRGIAAAISTSSGAAAAPPVAAAESIEQREERAGRRREHQQARRERRTHAAPAR